MKLWRQRNTAGGGAVVSDDGIEAKPVFQIDINQDGSTVGRGRG